MSLWFQNLQFGMSWALPLLALILLWLCRFSHDAVAKLVSERLFYAVLLFLAGVTLRTIAINDPAWLLHTTALGVMVVGGIIPFTLEPASESTDEAMLPY